MINNANEFMIAFFVMCVAVGVFVVFLDFPFKGKMPRMA